MELEIKVMWCKGLTAFNFFQKLAVYAAVSIAPEDKTLKLTQDEKQEHKTPVDQEGNGNPEWNCTMKFNLSPQNISSNINHLSLLFELRNHGQLLFGDKEIGEVQVPLKDLVESVGTGLTRLVSYEVRGPDGKPNGILDFSYKVINNIVDLGNCVSDSQVQISGYGHHHPHHHHHHHQESRNSDTSNGYLGHCVSDSHVQISGYGGNRYHQETHISGTSESERFQYTNNGYLGHSVSDSRIQMSGHGYHSRQESHFSGTSLSSVSERIEYPKIDSEMSANPMVPSSWAPRQQPPSWGPPPPPTVHNYSSPPPPPPRILPPPPPPDQQTYAYRPPPYGDPYWAYNRPPPNYQQPTSGSFGYGRW